ncbi:MAG: sensor histidine kinase, partial [Gammaproteobacteria bacterium]
VTVSVLANQTIEVRDEGPGIDEAAGSRVFERFFRSPTNKFPGSGLGLAIVAEVMKQHAGTVGYFNCHKGGACFYMNFGASSQPVSNL